MVSALLFDLDGTLVETDSIHFRIWQTMLRQYGLDIDRSFYQSKISGRLNPDIVRELLPQLSPGEQAQFVWDKEADFRQRADDLHPMPGLGEVLAWANQHSLKQAVVSNAPRENVAFMLATLGLEQSFNTIVLGDDLPRGKPDPLPYQEALHRLAVPAAAAIAFEDSPSGMRSAVGAGVPTVGIASTHHPETLYALGAAIVVDDFTAPALWEWLQQRMDSATAPVP